jgi:DNA-binding XRE family transcriptional regulator
MKLENLLKQYRKDHALTQEEMAEKIGINRCLYNQIEKGKTKVSSKTIQKVAKALYLKPGYIVDMLKGE